MQIQMRRANVVASVLLIALSALALVETSSFTSSAALVPRITLGLIVILAAMQLAQSTRQRSDKTVAFEWRRITLAIALVLAYAILMNVLGYYVATFCYTFAAMYLFGIREKLLLIPLCFLAFVYVAFVRLLSIPVPQPFFLG